jgi:shikimate kinase
VYWLGGSACAGKTSVARLVAAAHGLALYSCDERFEEHRRRADPERHSRFCRIMDLSAEELWEHPAQVQAAELLGFYEDEMEMVLEDLAAFSGPVLAEGVGLLPDRIAEVLAEPWRAVWLAATPELRRRASSERAKEALGRCSDPEGAFSRWMERDTLVAAALEQAARSRGLDVLVVDGRRSVEENAADVARRLRLRGA